MAESTKLQLGRYYHIYHRGNNREPIFFEPRNYGHFLKLYIRYIEPVANTYAYSLLNNHFHLSIRTKTKKEQAAYQQAQTSDFFKKSDVLATQKSDVLVAKILDPSEQFRRFFISYAKSINKAYGRTGSLFENKFGRIEVTSARYFYNLITYIHHNPQKHGFVDDFRDWPYSSYHAILSDEVTRVGKTAVLDWFGGASGFVEAHQTDADERLIYHLIDDD